MPLILIVGAGRVGSSVARSMLAAGNEVSVLDEDPLSHERLDSGMDTTWEDSGGRFTVGHGLEIDALHRGGHRGGRRLHRLHRRRQHEPHHRPDRRASSFGVPRVIVRVMDPRRAEWYAEQGLHTICPTALRDRDVRAGAGGRSSMYVVDRRGRQGRLEPRPRADRQGPRGDAHRERALALPRRRAGARARDPVRRRHRAVGARARRHQPRRPGHRGHRRRRGQPPDLPDRQGEVPLLADHRPRQQPPQPPVLRAAGHPAGGQRHRPDPAPHRARGPRPTASSTCSTCATSSSRSSRSRSARALPPPGARWPRSSCPTAR